MTVAYGRVRAVRDISLGVDEGQVVALLGPNGAGKTTTMRAIMGLVPIAAGRAVFAGHDVTNQAAHKRSHGGLALVPEGRGIVPGFTVAENLRLGALYRNRDSDWDEVYELFPRIRERLDQTAGSLSGGEQQMVAIARAIVARSRLLLLDEPTMGLAPVLVQRLFEVLETLRERGTSMLIAEQNARRALELADFAYVLQRGTVVEAASADQLREEETIVRAYLQ